MAWNDPLDPDNNEPLVFTFEIGPMKVTVPDIIQEAGVDGGNLKKEVTYNGSLQTMSFMPVNTSYLNVDCGGLPYTLKDNVLMVTAQDAGTYVITISAKSSFIWETESPDAMVYTLIINEAEIDAPRFVDEDAVGNTKKVYADYRTALHCRASACQRRTQDPPRRRGGDGIRIFVNQKGDCFRRT